MTENESKVLIFKRNQQLVVGSNSHEHRPNNTDLGSYTSLRLLQSSLANALTNLPPNHSKRVELFVVPGTEGSDFADKFREVIRILLDAGFASITIRLYASDTNFAITSLYTLIRDISFRPHENPITIVTHNGDSSK